MDESSAEQFALPVGYADVDHRHVTAPYLWFAGSIRPDTFMWHLRIVQPNVSRIDPAAMHTIEHCFIALLPEADEGFVWAAPMGCRTGMYLISRTDDYKTFSSYVAGVLAKMQSLSTAPMADEVQCGACDMHDLRQAQRIARWLLSCIEEWSYVGTAPRVGVGQGQGAP